MASAWSSSKPPEPDDLIALPATWNPGSRTWQVELHFLERPRCRRPIERVDRRSREVQDVPSGLDGVTLRVHYQRWRTVDRRRQLVSPVPAALNRPGEKVTPQLCAYLRDTRSRLDLPIRHVARAVGMTRKGGGLNRRRLALLQVPRAGSADAGALTLMPNAALIRPPVMPRWLGIDEIFLGRTYWTVVSNNDPSKKATPLTLGQRVIGICHGRRDDDLLPMLQQIAAWYAEDHAAGQLPQPRPERVAADLWKSFWTACRDEMVFGQEVMFSTDRFHLERKVKQVWKMAQRACESCSECQARKPCKRQQWNRRQHALLSNLWTEDDNTWSTFSTGWQSVRSEVTEQRDVPDDYRELARLLRWRWEVLEQTFSGTDRPANGRAEAINRRIRLTMKHMKRRRPATPPADLLQQLHVRPVQPVRERVTLPPSALRCPQCAGPATLPASAQQRWQDMRLPPRGLTPLLLRVPARLQCGQCGLQDAPPPDHPCPALTAWLRAPLQRALPVGTLTQFTGLSPRQVLEVQGPATYQPVYAVPQLNPLVYDEIWTTRRVWCVLATTTGALVDLAVVDRRHWRKQEQSAEDAHLFPSLWTLRDAVARQAVRLLLHYSNPVTCKRVILHSVHRQLLTALHWNPKQLPKPDIFSNAYALDAYLYTFTLPPYTAHSLPQSGLRTVLQFVRRQELGTDEAFWQLIRTPRAKWESDALWQSLSRTSPSSQPDRGPRKRAGETEYQDMVQLLQYSSGLKRLLQGHQFEARNKWPAAKAETSTDAKAKARTEARAILSALLGFSGEDSEKTDLSALFDRAFPHVPAEGAGAQCRRWWNKLREIRVPFKETLAQPEVPTPHHPQLLSDLTRLLQDALHLSAEAQRARVLAALQAERALDGKPWPLF